MKAATMVMKPNQLWEKFIGVRIIPQGEKWLKMSLSGSIEEITGPTMITSAGGVKVLPLKFHTASQNEYLSIKTLLGEKMCLPGPTHIYENPMIHDTIQVNRAIELFANEALVVYTPQDENNANGKSAMRHIVHGPCIYVPRSGSEYIHNFQWHGVPLAVASSEDVHIKVPRALKFTKLRTIPDQMYIDVPNVRTADDALLIIRTMVFFHLQDINKMLDSTIDPVADFVNGVGADVIQFCQERTFEQFKTDNHLLNNLDTYKQLKHRCETIGYKVNKVVFRGYHSSNRLQKMHDEAIEKRTALVLERENEEQAQKLSDFRLIKQKERMMQELQMESEKLNALLEREKKTKDAKLEADNNEHKQTIKHREEASLVETKRLDQWKSLGVDLTQYLVAEQQKNVEKVIQINNNGGSSSNPSNGVGLLAKL